MQDPNNLRVTAEAEELAVMTYVTTRRFPDCEQYAMTAQMRRAAISVGSNIVEGRGRQRDASLLPFLFNAIGSTGELQFQIRDASRVKYGDPIALIALADQADKVHRMLANLISSLQRRERLKRRARSVKE